MRRQPGGRLQFEPADQDHHLVFEGTSCKFILWRRYCPVPEEYLSGNIQPKLVYVNEPPLQEGDCGGYYEIEPLWDNTRYLATLGLRWCPKLCHLYGAPYLGPLPRAVSPGAALDDIDLAIGWDDEE